MKLQVGDKVRVTTDDYPMNCPRGTICTVVQLLGYGRIDAKVDGGGEFRWFLKPGQYEPLAAEEPDYNYAEQAAKYGITITVELIDGNVIVFDGKKKGEHPDA